MIIQLFLIVTVAFADNSPLSPADSSTTQTFTSKYQSESFNTSNIKSSNDPCQWKVNYQYNGANATNQTTNSISGALNITTCSGGYEFSLVNLLHYEYLPVNEIVPIEIKGAVKNEVNQTIRTTWKLQSSAISLIIIHSGIISLQDLEFNFTQINDGTIWPTWSLIQTSSTVSYKQLSFVSCVFNGLGSDTNVGEILIANPANKLLVSECYFQNAKVDSIRAVAFDSQNSGSELQVESTQFINIVLFQQYALNILHISTKGDNMKIYVNNCSFINCINNGAQGAGAVNIISYLESGNNDYIITNNKFTNNRGQKTGGLLAQIDSKKCQFQNNIFQRNFKAGSDQRGCDASLHYSEYTDGWTSATVQSIITDLFDNCTGSNENSIYYEVTVNGLPDQQGYINITKSPPENCYSKAEMTADCICDPDSTTYPVAQCQKDKLCITDLEHQSKVDCPCLNTSDPRAGKDECPAYCQSQNDLTEVCICDTESITYPLQICVIDKKCKFDLVNQLNTTCSCLSTSDPRAGKGQCPAYCIKGQVNASCTCDTGSSQYPLAQCQQDQKCITDLSHQTAANCPCLSTDDPRAGQGQCPAYCTGPNTPSGCVCDTNPHAYYPPQTCNSDKKCTQPSNTNVEKDSCTCSSTNYPTGCKCPANSTELTGIPQSRCECRNTGDPRAGKGECPEYCVKDSLTQQCVCDTGSQTYPSATCEKDKKCKFELATQTNVTCPCLSTGDPRAGKGQCPYYCTSKDQPNANCVCDSNPSAQYPPSTCNSEKRCTSYSYQTVPTNSCTCSSSNHPTGCKCPTEISQLIGIPQSRCECLSTGDPRAGNGQCPAYCVKGSITSDCFCDTGLSDYSQAQCIQDQKCKFELINQNSTYCQCLSTGDPRAGKGQCPAYCTSKDQPNKDCACDSGSTSYPPSQCQQEKQCTASSSSQVPQDSCTCVETNYPQGCKCPNEPQYLVGISKERCECRTTGDPRANGICPAYCIKDSLNSECICDTGSYQYPSATCTKDKACKFELINQTNTTCPCLSTGDPRAGKGQCPEYCLKGQLIQNCACDTGSITYPSQTCLKDKLCQFDLINQIQETCECLLKSDPRAGDACPPYCVKGQLSSDCVCELGSSYLQGQCEIDKLCTFDLINQNITICPCLAFNDPRYETFCKQEVVDPPITDPDPSDTKHDDEQQDGQKQEEEKTEEESSSANLIMIISITVGVLIIISIVLISLFIIRQRQKKNATKKKNNRQEISLEILNRVIEQERHRILNPENQQSSDEQNNQQQQSSSSSSSSSVQEYSSPQIISQSDPTNTSQSSSDSIHTILSQQQQQNSNRNTQKTSAKKAQPKIDPKSFKIEIISLSNQEVNITRLPQYSSSSSQSNTNQHNQTIPSLIRNPTTQSIHSQDSTSSQSQLSQSTMSTRSQQSYTDNQSKQMKEQTSKEKPKKKMKEIQNSEIDIKDNKSNKKQNSDRLSKSQVVGKHSKERSSKSLDENNNDQQKEKNSGKEYNKKHSRSKSSSHIENDENDENKHEKEKKEVKKKNKDNIKVLQKNNNDIEDNQIDVEQESLKSKLSKITLRRRTRNEEQMRQRRPSKKATKVKRKIHQKKTNEVDDNDWNENENEIENRQEEDKSNSHINKISKKKKNDKNKKNKSKDKDFDDSSSSSSSITSSSSLSSSSSSSSSSSQLSTQQQNQNQSSQPQQSIIPPVIHPFYESNVLDRSFRSPSESHRGDLNESSSDIINSQISLSDYNERRSNVSDNDVDQIDGSLYEDSQVSNTYLWDMYEKLLV